MPPEELTVGRPDQLQGWTYRPEAPLTSHPAYTHFFNRVKKVAEATWAANPKFQKRLYQCEAAALYCTRRANLCAGSQGVGKTLIVALTIAGLYPHLARMRPGVVQIVAPSLLSARNRWIVDLERVPFLQGLVQVLSKRSDWLHATAPIWVYHREFLTLKSQANRRRPWLAQELAKNRPPCLLVVDEIHHFKPGNVRTQALTYLRWHSRRCLGLSGTLTDSRLDLLHHLCRLVYEEAWPFGSEQEFRRHFGCKEAVRTRAPLGELEDEEPRPKRYLDFIALPKLGSYVQTVSRFIHRLTLDQPKVRSCCIVPAQVDCWHSLPASPEQLQAHRALVQQHRGWIEQVLRYGSQQHVFSLFQPLLDLCWLPPEGKNSVKFHKLVEIIRQSTKTGVFVASIESGRLLTEWLNQEFPGQVVRLYAQDLQATPKKLSLEQREAVLEELLYREHIKVGVLSLNLASESLDLVSLDHLCFWGLSWSSLQIAQALARVVRPGSPFAQVHIHWMYHQGLLDEHQTKLLWEKQRAAKRLLDYDPYLAPSWPELNVKQILADILHENTS